MPPATEPLAAPPERVAIPPIPPDVQLLTLDNGLTIVIREDHTAPVVSAQAWCRAGSIDEGDWIGGGLSHVLEHMLFKGTTTRGAARIDQEIQEAGGYVNAYTSFDRTVFWIDVPNGGAIVAVDVLSDIMLNATLPEDELAKEMEVIRREMDMGYDDPARRSGRRLFETAYTRSPYRFTTIGYPDVFNRLERDDIVAHYRAKYTPNNLFFVVVGDVKADAVVEQIKKAFADIPSRPPPPTVLPDEPRQLAPREVVEEAAINLGHLHCSWHIPDLRHPDVPVLDVLAALLGGGRSSRLFQEVREKRGLVSAVDAWTYNPGNAGLLGLSAVMEPSKFPDARDAMLAQIDRMRNQAVPKAELAKAVKQFVSATLGARKTMQGQAQDLGSSFMAAGDLNFSARYLEAVRRVTPRDLLRVACTYLTEENRTLYALLPQGTAPTKARVAIDHSDKPVSRFELPNGLRLLAKEDHRLPFVQFRLSLQAGVLAETATNNGVTLLLARMLMQGTASRSAEELASLIESVGGSLDTYSANNSFGVSAEVMREDFELGLELTADVLLRSTLPEEALQRERDVQLASIKAQEDQLLHRALRSLRTTMFGDCGYGLDALGSAQSVSALTRDDLTTQRERLIGPRNAVLAVFGDIDAEQTLRAVERRFGHWESDSAPPDRVEPDRLAGHGVRRSDEEIVEKKQAVIVVAFPGTTLAADDRYALDLLQEACSDLGSRIFLRIREQLGLAYYVGAQHFPGLIPGYFAFYAGTAPEQADQVESELLKEALLLAEDGLTEAELRRAKAKVVGQKKIARQDLGTLATSMVLDELYGLGYDHIDQEDVRYEAVSLETVKNVASKYLRGDRAVIATVKGRAESDPAT